ncbi:hypothetical protein CHS0354_015316 [Potamilus streckersoni]|uniref:Uncharacterized protein n=1 Tax=Potamilus streckersoni TaxID=2493646 RepID=A0AAE0W809_9BIVA|nr:hypothetical protein CHS0354_015316 [Potamilus streckersoni]
MALEVFLSVVVVSCLFGQSLQDDDCTLVTWDILHLVGSMGFDDQDIERPDLVSKCTAGDISVNYPKGTINVTFPWSLLPNGTSWARVCLKQTGHGVFSATDITQGENRRMDLSTSVLDPQAAGDLNRYAWFCTNPHRIPNIRSCVSRHLRCRTRPNPLGPKGIRLALYFGEDVELYLQILKYKMEEGERPRGRDGKSG